MKIQQIAEEMVKLIREGNNKQAKNIFYADDIVSVEGNGDKLEALMQYTKKVLTGRLRFQKFIPHRFQIR